MKVAADKPATGSSKVVLASLFLTLALTACHESSSPTAPLPPRVPPPAGLEGYSVIGQITAASTNAPLADARIEVTEEMDDNTHVTSSDASGMFRVSGLRGGFSYYVAISRTGFTATQKIVSIPFGSTDPEIRADFKLLEDPSARVELNGNWHGTITISNDPQDDQVPCPLFEQIAGGIVQSGSAVIADLSGACNRAIHFDGILSGGSLAGTMTIAFPSETFTGSATGTASDLNITLNATLRSPLNHTMQGLSLTLTR